MNDKELPTIDFDALVQIAGENEEMAQEMLSLFMDELPDARQHITEAFQQKDWGMLKHHLHRLHGALCYSGALRLKALTAHFEKQVITNPGHQDAEYAQLMKEIEVLILAYHEMMDGSSHL